MTTHPCAEDKGDGDNSSTYTCGSGYDNDNTQDGSVSKDKTGDNTVTHTDKVSGVGHDIYTRTHRQGESGVGDDIDTHTQTR